MHARQFMRLCVGLILLFVVCVPQIVSAQGYQPPTACCINRANQTCRSIDAAGACYGTESRKDVACSSLSQCSNPNTGTSGNSAYHCCLWPPVGGQETGRCDPITSYEEQGWCTGNGVLSSDNCTENQQCIDWEQGAADFYVVEDPVLVTFIPSVSIPGSSIFNEGEPIVLTGKTMGEYIAAIYVFLVGVAGILSTVFMMYGGVQYIISLGNPSKLQGAKDTIYSALIGLLIAVASYVILLTINPNLVEFDGLRLSHLQPLAVLEHDSGTDRTGGYVPSTNQDKYDNCINETAGKYGISRTWLKALMLVESNGNPTAESPAHAYGLVQLLLSTAQDYMSSATTADLLNPAINLDIAGHYYRDLLYDTCPERARYRSGKVVSCDPTKTQCRDGDNDYANAAYNGGLSANCSSVTCEGKTWWECEANEGYAETRTYVARVRATYEKIVASNESGSITTFDWNFDTPTCTELRNQ